MASGQFRLVVGLGNPGSRYNGTRHNIGFRVLESLVKKKCAFLKESKKLHGLIAQVPINNALTRVLLPNTYMNESGKSVRATLDWFGIEVSQVLVLVDDIDLPLGRLRLRSQGGSGGHNGLKSIINHIGTQNFCRLRIGIGAPCDQSNDKEKMTISHVLGHFKQEELLIVEEVVKQVISGLDLIQDIGFEKAGNQ